jgi:UDP-N-acetylmuramoyl-L-alanyl-D-glutamate--2,6-diaminopimelate ligase
VERLGDTHIVGVSEDSRRVRPGWLFAALRGSHRDGHDLVGEAVSHGASAVMVQRRVDVEVPQLKVGSTRATLGPVCAAVYGAPSAGLDLVGVTGTNGKTTLSYLLAEACSSAGRNTGLVGTVETRLGRSSIPSTMTTPPASELQRTLASMRQGGADTVVMEVSSHALDQRRVGGCRFALALFTNMEAEHLDYHGTVEQYFASKATLFEPSLSQRAIVCADDQWGRRLAAQTSIPVLTYSQHGPSDVTYTVHSRGLDGIDVTLRHEGYPVRLQSRLIGLCNGANVAGAYLAAVSLGIAPHEAAGGIARCDPPPGRFEVIRAGQPFLVVVDYAHTPQSLQNTLSAARQLVPGRTILVVGARGGRDRYKRPDTAEVASRADRAVITTDNPGDEDPGRIVEQLRTGLIGHDDGQVTFEPNRGSAIAMAVAQARPDDAVLIVGRGHETTFRLADQVVTLDDRQAALAKLRQLGYRPRTVGESPRPAPA